MLHVSCVGSKDRMMLFEVDGLKMRFSGIFESVYVLGYTGFGRPRMGQILLTVVYNTYVSYTVICCQQCREPCSAIRLRACNRHTLNLNGEGITQAEI